MSYLIAAGAVVLSLVWVPVATYIDKLIYDNESLRGHVLMIQKPPVTDLEVYDAYFKQNLFEAGLFVAGVLVGAAAMWLWF